MLSSELLQLIPLTLDQLYILADDRNILERQLNLALSHFEISSVPGFVDQIIDSVRSYVIPKVEEFPDDYLWFTHWLIVLRDQNLTVGGIGGSGLPDANGCVKIGYYIDEKFEGKGFATQAVGLFKNWLSQHEGVRELIADTPVYNLGSQQVLKKNGFELAGGVEEGLRWRAIM